jgi:SAM-dependent methyltransferase
MLSQKPYAESSEQNKEPILSVIREVFVEPGTVLEIGAGTGQHAVYFSSEMSHLTWQPTERADQLAGIRLWREEAGLSNINEPLELDVTQEIWPIENADMVFSANTVHIMSWPDVMCMFSGLGKVLRSDGLFCLYGPFNYNNEYTSESNARFDIWLKDRDPESGIRNFEDLEEQAKQAGMGLFKDFEMPENNRILVWRKVCN